MSNHDPLDDLGLNICPNCLEPMQPAGTARELLMADTTTVESSAYWKCPACGMPAISEPISSSATADPSSPKVAHYDVVMTSPPRKNEAAAISLNIARVQRLLPQAKRAARLAQGTPNQRRADAAVHTLEQALRTLKRCQAQLLVKSSTAGATPNSLAEAHARAAPKPKPAVRTVYCSVCTQTVSASKSGRLLKHRLSTGRMCTEGVDPTPLRQEKKPKKNTKPDKFTRQTAWAIKHAASAGLPGFGKRT